MEWTKWATDIPQAQRFAQNSRCYEHHRLKLPSIASTSVVDNKQQTELNYRRNIFSTKPSWIIHIRKNKLTMLLLLLKVSLTPIIIKVSRFHTLKHLDKPLVSSKTITSCFSTFSFSSMSSSPFQSISAPAPTHTSTSTSSSVTMPLDQVPPPESPESEAIAAHPYIQHLKHRGFQQVTHLLYLDLQHIKGALTGDTLSGQGKISKYPIMYSLLGYDKDKNVTVLLHGQKSKVEDNLGNTKNDTREVTYNELYAFYHLGDALHGHPGIVHGGMLAVLLDEALYRCCYPLIILKNKNHFGVTANLNIDYKAPTATNQSIVVKSKVVKVDRNKYFINGRIENLVFSDSPEEIEGQRKVLVESTQLIVVPKWLDQSQFL